MRIAPEAKRPRNGRIEKWILRKAFEDLLPPEIVWRQKEQFSDGVGYGWIDSLKAFTEAAVSDREMAQAADRFPVNPPRNKEEYYYRTIFEECFPSQTAAQCVPSVPRRWRAARPRRWRGTNRSATSTIRRDAPYRMSTAPPGTNDDGTDGKLRVFTTAPAVKQRNR